MKANELRVGNWIEIITYQKITRGSDIDYAAGVAYPMILTTEILENCGFKKSKCRGNNQDWFIFDKGQLSIDYIDNAYRFSGFKTIKYVHQLQNLYFALIGEELEIYI